MKRRNRLILSLVGSIIATTTMNPSIIVPEIYAANIAVPTINQAAYKDDAVALQWDIPINDTSIFAREDFEQLGLDLPNNNEMTGVRWYGNMYAVDEYGHQRDNNDAVRNSLKIINGVGYGGTKGAKATKTAPNNGWSGNWYDYKSSPNGQSDSSYYYINDYKQLKVGKPAIVRLKAKGYGNLGVGICSNWSGNTYKSSDYTWAETLSPEELKARLMEKKKIKINNSKEQPYDRLHVTTAECKNYTYDFYLSVGSVEKIDNQWYFVPNEWHGAWYDCVKPGQICTGENRANTGIVAGKAIDLLDISEGTYANTDISTDDWKNYSFNISISNRKEIIDTGCYFEILHSFWTPSELCIDDVTIAYAPLSRVYRDGNLITQDYTAEYKDSEAVDQASPNAPTNMEVKYVQGSVNLSWDAVVDNGTNHTYTITSVDEQGVESNKSLEKVVNVAKGIDHYEIYEDGKLITTTNGTSCTLVDSVNLNKLSVIAVDRAGNKSDITTLEKDEILPTVTHKLNTEDWIKDSLTITVHATDEGVGVRNITTPDGKVIAGDTATFVVKENGKYTFKASDLAGNIATYEVEISKIDKNAPTKPGLEKEKDAVKLTPGTDNESGIKAHKYHLNQGEWKDWNSDLNLKSLEDGIYILEVKAIDNVGNESESATLDFKITYKQVQEAIEAVDKAEDTFELEDYEHARELVDPLDESDIKKELTQRLDMMKEILDEEILMKELKEIKKGVSDDSISEEEFDALVERFEIAKEKVQHVSDRTTKKRMQKLVDEIEAIIAAKKHHLTENTFKLTAVPQIEENNVALDWNTNINLLDYTYRIFASHNGSEVQSIPAKEEVKVLEIYPGKSYLPQWINSYDTVGKLTCDAISIEKFNANPEVAWDYDVVVLGFADSYNHKDLIETSANELKTYIESGKSVLFSHNTLSGYYPRPYLNSLASYLNLQTTGNDKTRIVSQAYIAQNGGLVNYPYAVGKLNEEVTVPTTHSYEIPSGDVWVKLGGNNQFYLTTWNNCAMIQAGHTPKTTNEAEQKLLLNTLYYLGQITENTTRIDYMGQDIDAPTTPEMSEIQTETKDGKLRFDLASEDQGTNYSYYVEATCLKDQSKIQSTTASALMLSGLEGYSIVIDEAENTVPDDEIEVTNNNYETDVDFSKPFYVHIKAIDKAGNSSEVKHYYYTDTIAPTTPSFKVENDKLILVPGEDYGFGIANHLYSINGEEWKEWNDNINLLELEDGTYTFSVKAVDKAQHESEVYTYTANVSYHQDAVNALLEKLQACKEIFEDYSITQTQFEETLAEFETLQEEVSQIEDKENVLANIISEIKVTLKQREEDAEASGTKAVHYVRLAERYQTEVI